MKRTYFIVKHYNKNDHRPFWWAHKRGLLSILGIYDMWNSVGDTLTYKSAVDCEQKLINTLNVPSCEVIGVVKL